MGDKKGIPRDLMGGVGEKSQGGLRTCSHTCRGCHGMGGEGGREGGRGQQGVPRGLSVPWVEMVGTVLWEGPRGGWHVASWGGGYLVHNKGG